MIKIHAPEIGDTGLRDTAIVVKLMQEGKINVGKNGVEGWMQDPYDVNFKNNCLRNQSDDAIYDDSFPEHPLTQSRKLIAKIQEAIEFKAELENIERFLK